VLRRLFDPSLQVVLRLELASLRRHEPDHDLLLALRQEAQRLEATGALVVPLHEETVHLELAQQRLLLEYDDERSGGFDPLDLVPDDKQVILGLVTTKGPRAETEDELEARVREAARRIDVDRLGLGTQCGFATSVLGNNLTVEDERAKLRTIARTAHRIWG